MPIVRPPVEIKEPNELLDKLSKLSEIFYLEGSEDDSPAQKHVTQLQEKVSASNDPNIYPFTENDKDVIDACWRIYGEG